MTHTCPTDKLMEKVVDRTLLNSTRSCDKGLAQPSLTGGQVKGLVQKAVKKAAGRTLLN